MSEQLGFSFDQKNAKSFLEYHAANPDVYRMFRQFALQLLNAGRKHIGAKMIAERIRFESQIKGDDGFKINNSYVAYFARMFERDFPRFEGVFEFRRSKADAEISIQR